MGRVYEKYLFLILKKGEEVNVKRFLLFWFRGPRVIFVFIGAFIVWGAYYVEKDPIKAMVYAAFLISAGIAIYKFIKKGEEAKSKNRKEGET